MTQTIHYDPRKPWTDMAPHGRKRSGHWEKPENPPRTTFSDPGERVFDRASLTWILPLPELPMEERKCRPLTVPRWDGSGVLWEIWEKTAGVLWVIEAADFDRAVVEKGRLCVESGFRPGWCRVRKIG